MAAAIALRGDYESAQLGELARRSEDADQVRRLLALALVYDGGSRSAGARAGGVGLQTFRDWVLRFNAKGPAGLVDGKAPGQVPRLDRAQRHELAQLVEDGPILRVHSVSAQVPRRGFLDELQVSSMPEVPRQSSSRRSCSSSCSADEFTRRGCW